MYYCISFYYDILRLFCYTYYCAVIQSPHSRTSADPLSPGRTMRQVPNYWRAVSSMCFFFRFLHILGNSIFRLLLGFLPFTTASFLFLQFTSPTLVSGFGFGINHWTYALGKAHRGQCLAIVAARWMHLCCCLVRLILMAAYVGLFWIYVATWSMCCIALGHVEPRWCLCWACQSRSHTKSFQQLHFSFLLLCFAAFCFSACLLSSVIFASLSDFLLLFILVFDVN